MRRYIARTVVVNTAREAFTGTVAAADADVIVLEHAKVIEPTESDLSGQVVVPAASVTWIQVV
ncbi:hypothetical protein NYO98_10500 [Nocardioides sp. STR2]|uniref:Uncharacterized protein n=1 Tax=Nocardioides pini TaxID=2975053 RepID=A0ABT4CCM7_9ACTN|nr:hypothetical protein [Nocardioides pini]MCY4726708.1 hypothetical protein [Nocardioides pini]